MKISKRWAVVFFYSIGIFTVTPFLPRLLLAAYSRWSSQGVSRFILCAELLIAFLILALGISFLIYKKKKITLYILISFIGIFLISFVVYQFLPNPNKFTHLPEYAILGFFIIRAFEGDKSKKIKIDRNISKNIARLRKSERVFNLEKEQSIKRIIGKNSYFLSILITGIIGVGDEIYQHFLPKRFFGWPDIFLNILGGILGLLIFRGMRKELSA